MAALPPSEHNLPDAGSHPDSGRLELLPLENPHPVLRLNPHGETISANPAASCLLGSDVPPALRTAAVQAFSRDVVTELPLEIDQKWFTFSIVPHCDSECVDLFGHDITELREIQESVRQSEERLRLITENVTDAVSILDTGLRTLFISKSVTRNTGFTLGELRDMPMDQQLAPESYDRLMSALRRELASGDVAGAAPRSRIVEAELMRKDGTTVWNEILVTVLRDSAGKPSGLLAVARDITARRAAQDELHETQEALRQAQKLEAVGQLAGGVAHDFNNQLGGILGYADLLLSGLERSDPMRHDVMEIKRAAERGAALTRQLLAYSRKQVLQPQPIDLRQLIGNLERMLRRLIGEDIKLVTEIGADCNTIVADPGQIEQVLMNLVVNARDAMPHGGVLTIRTDNTQRAEINLDLSNGTPENPQVVISVSDTGCGMDKDVLEHIFEPFFTTKEPGKGTGLGLSTVHGIVTQSGGEILVRSQPGEGTCFQSFFPAANEAPNVDRRPSKPWTQTAATETVLVAEDEGVVRRLVSRILGIAGYRVIEVDNGVLAKRKCEEHSEEIHLLVTDIAMPEMNGQDLACEVIRMRPEIKVLFISGYLADVVPDPEGLVGRGKDFLAKPFSAAELLEKVRNLLDGTTTIPPLRVRNSEW